MGQSAGQRVRRGKVGGLSLSLFIFISLFATSLPVISNQLAVISEFTSDIVRGS
jgi:hypothetical protein